MDDNINKTCENCYYFLQHYHKNKRGKLVAIVGCGHCTNGNLLKSVSRKNISLCRACEFWTVQEPQITERREGICKVISEMRKTLNDIALILKED